jgi:hypothetical protein
MLRMRPKPPVGIPNLNSGKHWSATDIADLDDLVRDRVPMAEIAEFLRAMWRRSRPRLQSGGDDLGDRYLWLTARLARWQTARTPNPFIAALLPARSAR